MTLITSRLSTSLSFPRTSRLLPKQPSVTFAFDYLSLIAKTSSNQRPSTPLDFPHHDFSLPDFILVPAYPLGLAFPKRGSCQLNLMVHVLRRFAYFSRFSFLLRYSLLGDHYLPTILSLSVPLLTSSLSRLSTQVSSNLGLVLTY